MFNKKRKRQDFLSDLCLTAVEMSIEWLRNRLVHGRFHSYLSWDVSSDQVCSLVGKSLSNKMEVAIQECWSLSWLKGRDDRGSQTDGEIYICIFIARWVGKERNGQLRQRRRLLEIEHFGSFCISTSSPLSCVTNKKIPTITWARYGNDKLIICFHYIRTTPIQ